MKQFGLLILALFSFGLISCNPEKRDEKTEETGITDIELTQLEKYRPVFHFTPPENWINDPNGLVQFEGEYHLFYQYNPYGIQWGHMSWGHATSEELIRWEHHPVALFEEGGEMIFSGSAVADIHNTSGFCTQDEGCLVAIYTSHIPDEAQYQSLAYSNDRGRTWEKFPENPVLDIGLKNFRDPKVFWYDPGEKWVMVVSVPLEFKVRFYQSQNLKEWRLTGEFGNKGDTSKIWECPDLVRIRVEDTNIYKWMLIISSGSKYGDFTGMQYFVGEFDGNKFMADDSSGSAVWLDHGKDFYAAVTYNNLPEGMNPVLVGWVNNWRYANSIHTDHWSSIMSIPRELTLRKKDDLFQLIQRPVVSFYEFVEKSQPVVFQNHGIEEDDPLLQDISAGSFLLRIEFENRDADEFGIDVLMDDQYKTRIGYNVEEKALFVNRKESGRVDFHEAFASIESAPLSLDNDQLNMEILVDQSVIEVFAAEGSRVITDQVFPISFQEGMQLYAKNGNARVNQLEIYEIK
jgi:fructan beta-fructosidase